MSFALSNLDAVRVALTGARRVEASTYRMTPTLEHDLETAARRGAAVDVVLAAHAAGAFDDGLAAQNAASAERLRAAGVRVRLEEHVHLKAVVVDDVAWLDDRNFARTGPSNVVRDDDAADVSRVRAAIAGGLAPDSDSGDRGIAVDKAGALAWEARAIAAPSEPGVAISTESFGYGAVTSAMRVALRAGESVRLIVDRREASSRIEAPVLAAMARLGVDIRTANDVDKVALTGSAAWIGSANATFAGRGSQVQSDWGTVTTDAESLATLRARYERSWSAARPLVSSEAADQLGAASGEDRRHAGADDRVLGAGVP